MLYRTIARLVELGRKEGLREKVDILFTAGSLTEEEYMDLLERLGR